MRPDSCSAASYSDLPGSAALIARRIRIFGVVQGVGFRPFVANAARREGVRGSVCNRGSYVEIHAAGIGVQMKNFLHALEHEAPERSIILKMEVREESVREALLSAEGSQNMPSVRPGMDHPAAGFPDADSAAAGFPDADPALSGAAAGAMGHDGFAIIESGRDEGSIFVSPDIATCPQCRKELFDPKNRRYLHPFINCTACGPRLTILDAMPYDRERTSMKKFPMCPTCHEEYTTPSDRRYDAQPVCCNDCGPELFLYDLKKHREGEGETAGSRRPTGRNGQRAETWAEDIGGAQTRPYTEPSGAPSWDCRGTDAILRTREILRSGGIAAVKGIGGFHLCCDAADPEAVARLRKLKNRPFKPFAVMVKDLETARRECVFGREEEEMLTGPQKPILLLCRRHADTASDTLPETAAAHTAEPASDASGYSLNASASADTAEAAESDFPQGPGVPARTDMPQQSAPRVCAEAAPGAPTLGIMLPYAPVQMLLFDYPDGKPMTDCLIQTSGNPSGAPICMNDGEALAYLSPMCDVILTNNRDIRIRADDSVMMYMDGKPYMVRRSRGFAPLPVYFSGRVPERGIEDSRHAGPVEDESAADRHAASGEAAAAKIIDLRENAEKAESSRRTVLGIGGELKNTFCLADPEYLYLSPYIGDLADLRSVNALSAAVTRMEHLLEMKPSAVICDLHPRYNSTRFAQTLGLPVLYVQHHYAHILSCMAENDFHGPSSSDPASGSARKSRRPLIPADSVIGVSMDGTGYGTDGSIWGGEFMRCSYDSFERLGSIEPFLQAGGDRSSKEGWRIAVALLQEAEEQYSSPEGHLPAENRYADQSPQSVLAKENRYAVQSPDSESHITQKEEDGFSAEKMALRLSLCSAQEYAAQDFLLKNRINCVKSTSAGRLFDAMSALLGIKRVNTFEGEAATALEYAAQKYLKKQGWPDLTAPGIHALPAVCPSDAPEILSPGSGGQVITHLSDRFFTVGDTASLIRQLIGVSSAEYGAALFHEYLAQSILAGCRRAGEMTGLDTVALSGGCFQNRTLTQRARDLLEKDGFHVLLHSLVPPNDGGVALGQAVYGLYSHSA